MQTVIVSSSRSPHHNTQSVAAAIAGPLHARIVSPTDATSDVLGSVEQIGLGSGVYWWNLDEGLLQVVRRLPSASVRQAFVFATSGLPAPPFTDPTRRVRQALERRDVRVVGTFLCRGIDTWGPFSAIGGISRHRPDPDDFAEAHRFATNLPT